MSRPEDIVPGRTVLRRNAVLYLAVLALGAACVLGGVLSSQKYDERSESASEQDRYTVVQNAARAEVTAFLNIDYRNMDAAVEAVNEGATGEFKMQYDAANADLRRLLVDQRSVMTGRVLRSGVVNVDADDATVLVGTTGTVQNRSTNDRQQDREFRLLVELQNVDGEWLTSNIVFLDGPLNLPGTTE